MGALATSQEGKKYSEESKAKADVFLHQHIDEMLEFEYSNCDDPSILWKDLQSRSDHQREVLLLSGDLLERTFSTFHASNINLQQQYRLQNFKRYSDLNSNLLVAKKNNELLMKNNQTRPTGSLALPEANAINNNDNKNSRSKRGRVKIAILDNEGEFTSHDVNDYCMSVGFVVELPVAHVHTQNSLVESLIKRLQLIARPLIMRTKLLVSMWGHAILHVASLIHMRPSANHKYSPIQLAFGQEPNISHLGSFGRAVVTKSHIPAANVPTRVEIPNKQDGDNIAQESQKRLKRGRPIGSKDKNPRKRKGTEKNFGHDESVLDETQDIKTSPEEEMNDINKEMSINYSQTPILWDRNEIGYIY
ncbi:retrovirus-related pol polyprotein from transposon TNT 1-94 [Tanacetum coccineum]